MTIATPPAVLARLDALIAILADGRTTTDSGLPVAALELIDVQQSAAQELRELRASLAHPAAVDEDTQDAIDTLLNRMGDWSKAYPVDMFSEPTDEERDWLHATKPGLMDRIAASMGRHMAKCIAEDLAALTAALLPATPEGEDNV